MRSALSYLTATSILVSLMTTPAFAATPLFDGMYVTWTGRGEWDYNGLKSAITISGRLQAVKVADGYTLSLSGSISGVPRTAPFLTQMMMFKTSGTDRVIVTDNTQYFSPFWIDQGRKVGDVIQIGPVASPYTIVIETTENREILGKNIRCLASTYSIRISKPDSVVTVDGKILFDAYSGVLVGGSMTHLFTSFHSSYYERVTAEVFLSQTNVEIGGPTLAFPWLQVIAAMSGAVAACVLVIALLLRKKRRRRPAPTRPAISPPKEAVAPPPPRELPPEPPSPILPVPEVLPTTPAVKCRVCGSTIREGWVFCGSCGTPL